MAYNHHPQAPFWDFVRSFDQNGAGVVHSPPGHPAGHPPPPPSEPGFPFGGWGEPSNIGGPGFGDFHGHGRGGFGVPGLNGRRHLGRHGRREHEHERERERPQSRSRTPSPGSEHSAPEGKPREGESAEYPPGPPRYGRHGRAGHRGPRGRGCHGQSGRRGPPPPPPFGGPGGMGGFDLSPLFSTLNTHPISQQPWAQMLGQYAQQAGLGLDSNPRSGPDNIDVDNENTFTPPLDIFSTPSAYILHLALPGAKKQDVGVNWDTEAGSLHIAGVVYRPGSNDFLKTLRTGERKVGVFERAVKLPPAGWEGRVEDGEVDGEVDGEGISAKLEDGVLVVTVPKVEREWTEIKSVDIE
ncbi:hypothetical protein PZA11_004792 [Diplocarpon coronariae]